MRRRMIAKPRRLKMAVNMLIGTNYDPAAYAEFLGVDQDDLLKECDRRGICYDEELSLWVRDIKPSSEPK